MNQKCTEQLEKISQVFGNLVDGVDMLREAIVDEDDEKVGQAMDMIPNPKVVATQLEKFRVIMSNQPWWGKKGKAHA